MTGEGYQGSLAFCSVRPLAFGITVSQGIIWCFPELACCRDKCIFIMGWDTVTCSSADTLKVQARKACFVCIFFRDGNLRRGGTQEWMFLGAFPHTAQPSRFSLCNRYKTRYLGMDFVSCSSSYMNCLYLSLLYIKRCGQKMFLLKNQMCIELDQQI